MMLWDHVHVHAILTASAEAKQAVGDMLKQKNDRSRQYYDENRNEVCARARLYLTNWFRHRSGRCGRQRQ